MGQTSGVAALRTYSISWLRNCLALADGHPREVKLSDYGTCPVLHITFPLSFQRLCTFRDGLHQDFPMCPCGTGLLVGHVSLPMFSVLLFSGRVLVCSTGWQSCLRLENAGWQVWVTITSDVSIHRMIERPHPTEGTFMVPHHGKHRHSNLAIPLQELIPQEHLSTHCLWHRSYLLQCVLRY